MATIEMTGVKNDAEKPRFDLLSPYALEELAKVAEYGARKYQDRNWEGGMKWGRPFAALMRHAWAWARGESIDPETGLSHLTHAMWCCMALVHYEHYGIGEDDRSKPAPATSSSSAFYGGTLVPLRNINVTLTGSNQ